jgi:metal-responsive CopG/Arc/MetJ family transcriptional regulator
MVARVTIALPEDLLEAIDGVAQAEGLARSEVFREAAAAYLAQRSDERARATRQQAADESVAWLEGVAARSRRDDPSSLELLHELRDSSSAGRTLAPEDDAS